MRLRDRIAIVTGAGQGIGEATAKKMAQEGASVAVAEWNSGTGARVSKELNDAGAKSLFIKCDVASRRSVEAMVRKVLDAWGKVEILVNNAGFDRPATLLKVTDEDWEAVLGVHLKGTLNCIQSVIPYMIEKSYGKIINVSSVYGRSGGMAAVSYSSAKAGIVGLTKSVAREVGRYGINVNVILPGLTKTPTTSKMPEKYVNLIVQETPLRRVGAPEEIANVISFLASDEASFVTGACIQVSGGFRM